MYSKIKQVRYKGARRNEREIANEEYIVGDLVLHHVGNFQIMVFRRLGAFGADSELLPPLHAPTCGGISAGRMIWFGYQRFGAQDDPKMPTHLQEWRVEVLDQP